MSPGTGDRSLDADLDKTTPRERNPMLDGRNRLKLAVFCANVARGTSISFAETLPVGSWPESARLAQAADAAGLDGIIPLGRYKNNSRGRPRDDRVMEPWTWAAGVAALTKRIAVFATVQIPLFHPEMAAALSSTVDHISGGRFAINVVAGFNSSELSMFDITQRDHDERYSYADEWMDVLKRIWTSEEPFGFHGRYLKGVELVYKPLPLQKPYPVIMSAGASPAGRRFAAKHADMNFVHLPSFEGIPEIVGNAKREARDAGYEAEIFAGGYIVCADTEAEAWRRYHYVTRDTLDRAGAASLVAQFTSQAESLDVVPKQEQVDRMAAGFNALPLVGTPEQVVERMQQMADGGLAGLAISFDDYDDGIAAYDEALRPLLIDAGLRTI